MYATLLVTLCPTKFCRPDLASLDTPTTPRVDPANLVNHLTLWVDPATLPDFLVGSPQAYKYPGNTFLILVFIRTIIFITKLQFCREPLKAIDTHQRIHPVLDTTRFLPTCYSHTQLFILGPVSLTM